MGSDPLKVSYSDSANYAEYFIKYLKSRGFTTCFYLGGGNILHLMDAARKHMKVVTVTHENSAGIAAEYFNVAKRGTQERAFALVTAGPGVTNLVSAIAGAWLESRELLVVAGQSRTSLLSRGRVRQVGHQEIDGVGITSAITKESVQIDHQVTDDELDSIIHKASDGRKGPVFLEICLDVAAAKLKLPSDEKKSDVDSAKTPNTQSTEHRAEELARATRITLDLLFEAKRPMVLVGHGLSFDAFRTYLPVLREAKIPVATSWNSADFMDYDDPIYAGRPNTYGMRWANVLIQQADLVISLGASLGVQQTGFNFKEFASKAKLVRVDIDPEQLRIGHPHSFLDVSADAGEFLGLLCRDISSASLDPFKEWLNFVAEVKNELTTVETAGPTKEGFANPTEVIIQLSEWAASHESKIVSCSSGGTYTLMMQCFQQRVGQLLTNNKGLASMGYGLAGAIGTSFAEPGVPVVLFEGDGGFAQNLSELGTVSNNNLSIKIILFDNGGYASIRLSQKAFFNGSYLGCDMETGLTLPQWEDLFAAFEIPSLSIEGSLDSYPGAFELLSQEGPAALVIRVDPDTVIQPKITSQVLPSGEIISSPLHEMSPPLSEEVRQRVLRYL